MVMTMVIVVRVATSTHDEDGGDDDDDDDDDNGDDDDANAACFEGHAFLGCYFMLYFSRWSLVLVLCRHYVS